MSSKPSTIPDMRHINRNVPIVEVARVLNLRLDGANKIHCWHPDRHKHGDRTASVGIRTTNNTVKCFGCDSKPMGPIDFVMDVRGVVAADAALWIAAQFDVPTARGTRSMAKPSRIRVGVGASYPVWHLGNVVGARAWDFSSSSGHVREKEAHR